MKYSGYSKDRKRLPSPKPLTRSKLQSMLRFVEKDSKALCDLILFLQEGINPNTAPHPYWELLTELVHNSSVCGTFQYLGNEEVIDSLRKIADGQFKSFLTPLITTRLIFSNTSHCSPLSFGLALKRWGTPSLQLLELASQRSQNAWQSPILYLHLQQVTIFQFTKIS